MLETDEILRQMAVPLTEDNRRMLDKYGRKIGTILCHALRHDPQKLGLDMDPKGAWVSVKQLISKFNTYHSRKPFRLNVPVLMELVKTDGKQRYGLKKKGHEVYIRCNQGHSIPWIEMDFEIAQPPEYLYHGTSKGFLSAITTEGLKPMQRQKVHLSWDETTARKVGNRKQRYGDTVILTVLSGQRARDGGVFYLSENNIWLADEIEPKYLRIEYGWSG